MTGSLTPRLRFVRNQVVILSNNFRRWVRDRLWAQLGKRSPSENTFLLLLPVVGLLTGLAAVGISHAVAFLQHQFWDGGRYLLDAALENPWPLRIVIPLIGGLIVGVIGVTFKVETRGAGTVSIIQALALKGGHLSLSQTLPRIVAAIVTLATGGALGREGPPTQLGGALGSHLGRRFKLQPQQLRMLVCAASASALAAVYNAPIGGSLFALEVLMGNFALEVFGPVVVASVISTLVYRSALGGLPRFVVPHYQLVSAWELPWYLLLGIIAGVVSIIFVKALSWAQDGFEKMPGPVWLRPTVGFLLLGGLGAWLPHVFGNGYEVVNLALHEQFPWQLLLLLPAAKLVATALTFGSGGAGGLFMPSLVIGGLVGGAFGYVVHEWFPHSTAEYGAYALVGMGGIVAGTTHAPITAIMMIFEQTDNYQIVLPLMFVCIVSHATARVLGGRSLNDEALRRRGVVLPRGPEAGIMQTIRVADVMHDDVEAVTEATPFAQVVDYFLKRPRKNLYVVDAGGRYVGTIRLHSIKDVLHEGQTLGMVVARDLVDEQFPYLRPDEKLADTMDRFWREDAERLPVINNPTDRRLIGWMSKRDLIGVYSQEILRKRQLLAHFVMRDGDQRRDVFVELPEGFELRTVEIPVHQAARTLAQLAPRSTYGVHVLVLKRRDPATGCETVQLPAPNTQLLAGDRLVVIGEFHKIAQFMAALALPVPSE